MEEYDDTLALLGTAVGALLVLAGIGTIVGAPWATQGTAAAVVQVLGALVAIGIGVGLGWYTRTGELPV